MHLRCVLICFEAPSGLEVNNHTLRFEKKLRKIENVRKIKGKRVGHFQRIDLQLAKGFGLYYCLNEKKKKKPYRVTYF